MSKNLLLIAIFCSKALAQQQPSLQLDKWNRSQDFRQNFCDRQMLLYNDTIELKDALKGLNLNIVLHDYTGVEGPNKDLFSLNSNGGIKSDVGEYPGLFTVILDKVAEDAGFQWRDSYGVNPPYDPDIDGEDRSWTDQLEYETDTYDLSVEYWSKSAKRMKTGIAFPEGWYDTSIIIIEEAYKEQKFNEFNWMLPFSLSVWGLIIGTVVFSGLLYWLFDVMDRGSDALTLHDKPVASVFLAFLTATGHMEFKPNTLAARLLTWSLTFWALVISSAYTANMASYLISTENIKFKFDSLEAAQSMGATLCIRGGSYSDKFVTSMYPKLGKNMKRFNNEAECITAMNRDECEGVITKVATYEIYQRSIKFNEQCKLKWSGKIEHFVGGGFALAIDTGKRCTSLLHHTIDYHVMQLKATGEIDKIWEEFLTETTDNTCVEKKQVDKGGENDNRDPSLKLIDMGGIFILHAFFCCLSLSISLISVYCCNREKSGKKTLNDDADFSQSESAFDDNEFDVDKARQNKDTNRVSNRQSQRNSIWKVA